MVVSNRDLMYYGVDASVKYSFMKLINSKVIDPSYMLVVIFLEIVAGINPGAGLTLVDNVGLSLKRLTKNPLEIERRC
jgi:hypothetical protein